MEDIYTNIKLDNSKLKDFFTSLFSDLKIFYWDLMNNISNNFDKKNPNHISFTTEFDKNKLEFGFRISLYKTPDNHLQERALYIGKALSLAFNTKVLVPFTHPEKPDSPYFNILFEKEKTYLVYDADTSFADDTTGLIKIIKEYFVPVYIFDDMGKYIGEKPST